MATICISMLETIEYWYDHRLHVYWLEVFPWNYRIYIICPCRAGLIFLDMFVFCFVCQKWHNTRNIFLGEYHCCWRPVNARNQGISSHAIGLAYWNIMESAPEGLILYLNTLAPNVTDGCQIQLVCGQWPEAGKFPSSLLPTSMLTRYFPECQNHRPVTWSLVCTKLPVYIWTDLVIFHSNPTEKNKSTLGDFKIVMESMGYVNYHGRLFSGKFPCVIKLFTRGSVETVTQVCFILIIRRMKSI